MSICPIAWFRRLAGQKDKLRRWLLNFITVRARFQGYGMSLTVLFEAKTGLFDGSCAVRRLARWNQGQPTDRRLAHLSSFHVSDRSDGGSSSKKLCLEFEAPCWRVFSRQPEDSMAS